MAWYNASWDYRVKVTVQSSKVPGDLTDFPVYVDLSDLPAGFFTNVKSDGSDIRVTTSDETTEVPREVVTITTGSSIGQLYFKGDLLGASDVDFYIYYGNSGASEPAVDSTYGAENVWDSNFLSVYHFIEDPSGSAPQLIDSTSNDADCTSAGTMTSGDLVTGDGGFAWDFDGTDDRAYIARTNTKNNITSAVTFFARAYSSSTPGTYAICSKARQATNAYDQYLFFVNGTPNLSFRSNTTSNGQVAGTTSLSTSAYESYHAQKSGTTQEVFLSGVSDGSNSSGNSTSSSSEEFNVGANRNSSSALGAFFEGVIAELRISDIARSSNWMVAEHNNVDDTSTFYTPGSQESVPAAPVAAFSGDVTSGEKPLTVTFTDASTNTPTSWSWTFGDSNSSTSQNPVNVYAEQGTYTVSLTATNATGSDDEVKTGYITVLGSSSDVGKTKGTAEIARRYPVTSGLGADNKHEGRRPYLKARKSFVKYNDKRYL